MILALLSDLHANLGAVRACLKHAEERGAERFAFLGDLVGYGAEPGAVVDLVNDYVRRGAVVVRGNHDAAIGEGGRGLGDLAYEAVEWTRGAISNAQKEFLAGLPLIVKEDDLCFVHSSAERPERWIYVQTNGAARESIEAANATYTFAGHVHEQILYFHTPTGKTAPFRPVSGSAVPVPSHRRWHAIVGSVGQPRDGNPAAAYALFDSAREEITFYRVPYDHLAAAAKVRAAGLPEALAQRLERGA